MNKIVIIGAGFGGLNLALGLAKAFKNDHNVSITLADKNDYHFFSPNLHKAAAADEELVSIKQLKQSVALPLKEILTGKSITFVKGELSYVDQARKRVTIGRSELEYDYLVLALGQEPEYYGIPGAEQHGLPLSSLPDALRIRNQLEFLMQTFRLQARKNNLRIAIAGQNANAAELALEFGKNLEFISWKNRVPRSSVELEIVCPNNCLAGDLDKASDPALRQRLKDLGVKASLDRTIAKVEKHFLDTLAGEKIYFDLLVWLSGSRAKTVKSQKTLAVGGQGRIAVNGLLQAQGEDNIFVIGGGMRAGDQKQLVECSPWEALNQAKYLTYALPVLLKNRRPKEYCPGREIAAVDLGGRQAIYQYGQKYAEGFFAYLRRQCLFFRYFADLIGFWKAAKFIFFESEIFSRGK
ncbi:MAG: FAD-dependent oxidoreductase [Patescibacteria group bacterium]|nr:FAD-dependent oxidoreductase [Patescibacteria group bacterium]